MKTNEIKTLQQFADIINEADEWKLEFYDIIKQNGWTDDTDRKLGVCHDKREYIRFNEQGIAEVHEIDIEGIVRHTIAWLRSEKQICPLPPDKLEQLKRLEKLDSDIAQGFRPTLDDLHKTRP